MSILYIFAQYSFFTNQNSTTMKTNLFLILFLALSTLSLRAQDFVDINAPLPGLLFSSVAFGDVDNDGDLDLYLSGVDMDFNHKGGLYLYENGNYMFSPESNLPLTYLGAAEWGDVNGDNLLDIIIMGTNDEFEDFTEIYKNNGDGTFTSMNAGIAPVVQGDVHLVDIDGDGDLDVAITGIGLEDRITKLYENDGNGNFTEMTDNVLPGMNLGRIKWADYNNDGHLDFVLAGFNDSDGGTQDFYTKIHTNNGDGTFSVADIPLTQCWLGDIEWGDYNNDGNPDLVISGAGGDGIERFTLVYRNNGDGTFTELGLGLPGVSHSSIEWADFNGDGRLDLFVVGETDTPGEGSSISKIYFNMGDDNFVDSEIDVFNISYYGDADVGDFDNDGKIDLVITGYSEPYYSAASSVVYKNEIIISTRELKKDFTISPVPAKDFLSIKSSAIINRLTMHNMSGQLILSQELNDLNHTINTEKLPRGLYLITIYTPTEVITEKVIIE